jgi:hypothetical protein
MERFVRRQNVEHFQQLLAATNNEIERQKIMKLLAEERQKQRDAGDSARGAGDNEK